MSRDAVSVTGLGCGPAAEPPVAARRGVGAPSIGTTVNELADAVPAVGAELGNGKSICPSIGRMGRTS